MGASSTPRHGHAVVIGASIAGLLAARVLSEHFERVSIIERDVLPGSAEPRRGVPQGRHAHTVLSRGQQILSELFPGLMPSLLARGATQVRTGGKASFASDLTGISVSRPVLEFEMRKRVAALPNVAIADGTVVTRFCMDWERARLTGVHIRGRGLYAVEERLPADLIVDASGRGSQTPRRLVEMGYMPPPESTVKVILDAHPTTEGTGDAVQVNWRRHYESITRFPIGLMVLGDALCSLNPAYAQGITVSALEAMLLETCLCELSARRMPTMDALTHNFRERVAELVHAPWQLAMVEDFRVARAVGKRSLKLRFRLWYASRLRDAARASPAVAERLDQVWNMALPRGSLVSLKIVKELLRLKRRRDRAVAEIHAANENFAPPEEERPFVQTQPFAQTQSFGQERRCGC